MQTTTKAMRPILLSLLVVLTGCFNLSRGAPSQQHYVLGGDLPREALALDREDPELHREGTQLDRTTSRQVEDSAGAVIGLRPPRFAQYLATPFIVVRRGAHRIEFSEFHRWGEDLGRGVNRTVAGHLVARGLFQGVETAPWPPAARPDYVVQLHFLRFEGVASEDPDGRTGESHLLANWEILRPEDGFALQRGTTEVRGADWTVGDHDALVGLLDQGLARLAEDLVVALSRAGLRAPQ